MPAATVSLKDLRTMERQVGRQVGRQEGATASDTARDADTGASGAEADWRKAADIVREHLTRAMDEGLAKAMEAMRMKPEGDDDPRTSDVYRECVGECGNVAKKVAGMLRKRHGAGRIGPEGGRAS